MTQNESQDFRCFPTEIPKKNTFIKPTKKTLQNTRPYSTTSFFLGQWALCLCVFGEKARRFAAIPNFPRDRNNNWFSNPFFFLLEQLVPAAEFWCNGKRALCENWSFEDAQTCSEFPWLHLMKLRKKMKSLGNLHLIRTRELFSTNFHSRHDSKKSRVTLSKFSNSVRA